MAGLADPLTSRSLEGRQILGIVRRAEELDVTGSALGGLQRSDRSRSSGRLDRAHLRHRRRLRARSVRKSIHPDTQTGRSQPCTSRQAEIVARVRPRSSGRLNVWERIRLLSGCMRSVATTAPEVRPVGIGAFGSRLAYDNLVLVLRVAPRLIPRLSRKLHEGDFRHWAAIRSWAASPALLQRRESDSRGSTSVPTHSMSRQRSGSPHDRDGRGCGRHEESADGLGLIRIAT
jgi:hypothetical protein